MNLDKETKKERCDIEISIIFTLSKRILNKNFKIEEISSQKEPVLSLKVRFSNGIIWRCIPQDIYKDIPRICETEEIILIKCELLNADIGKSVYEVIFLKPDGEIVFKSRETVRPLELLNC